MNRSPHRLVSPRLCCRRRRCDRCPWTATAADALPDLAAVESHWRTHHTDGVGVTAGVQTNGSTIFAVKGTMAALRGWLADAGTEVVERHNEYGALVSSSRTYRPTTPFVQISWTPPPARPRSVVSYGAGLVDSLKDMRSDRADEDAH